MFYRRWRTIAILVMVLSLLLAACATEVTEEPTEEPTATEEVVDATAEAATEEVDVEVIEPTEEMTEEVDVEVVEPTEEITTVAEATEADVEIVEPTEEMTEEEADVETIEPTEEMTEVAEATEEMTEEAEPTEEMTEEAEATEEAEGTEETDEVGVVSAEELGLPYTFSYTSDFEATVGGTTDTVNLIRDDQKVVVVGPASYTRVLGAQEFESDAEELAFFLDRAGYEVGEAAESTTGLASVNVSLPRANQVGVATLLDLQYDRRAVVLELGADTDNLPSEAAMSVMNSLAYPPNIVDVASTTDGFSTLVAAVEAAGVDLTTGEFTVFAPTDEAFTAALEAMDTTGEELLADTETLTAILNYHVVEGTMLASDLSDGQELTTVNGATLTVNVTDDGVTLTDASGNTVNVVQADVTASNGVIHVIDSVLMPPMEAEATEEPTEEAEATEEAEGTEETDEASVPTILGAAIGNEDLSTLATAVVRAGLHSTLNGEGPFTVFAPTNDAFATALEGLGLTADELMSAANRDQLTSILTYHVVEGEALMSGDLSGGQELTTVNGATLTVNVTDDGVTVTDAAGNTYNVVTADVQASNGVVHVIDGVLLPTSGE